MERKDPIIVMTPVLLDFAKKLRDPNLLKTRKKFQEAYRKPPTQSELTQYARWSLSATFEWTAEDSKMLQKLNAPNAIRKDTK